MIAGCNRIHVGEHIDARGSLFKPLSSEFAAIKECFYSWSKANVLRGMHWQPYQAKIVVCITGHVLDVLLDMRKDSPTYRQGMANDLHDGSALYIAPGVAHGFYAHRESLMLYLTTAVHRMDEERGVRWDSFACLWPCTDPIISDRDKALPPLGAP